MKPSDARTFEKGNSNAVVLAVGVWAARDGMLLPIDMTGDSAHTTVTNRPGSARDHRILFRDLRKMLMANGCWEFCDGGAEGQATGSDED